MCKALLVIRAIAAFSIGMTLPTLVMAAPSASNLRTFIGTSQTTATLIHDHRRDYCPPRYVDRGPRVYGYYRPPTYYALPVVHYAPPPAVYYQPRVIYRSYAPPTYAYYSRRGYAGRW